MRGGAAPEVPAARFQPAGARRSSQSTARGMSARVDVVHGPRFAVVDVEAGRLEQIAGATGELTPITGSLRPWAMNTLVSVRVQSGLPAIDGGDEARKGEKPGGSRTVGSEPERVAHHGPHREAAEHGALGEMPVRCHSSSWSSARSAYELANVPGSG